MRLIDADALKELFPDNGEGSWTYNITARMYINNAPTVTPDKIQAIMSDYLVYRSEPQRPTGGWTAVPYDSGMGIVEGWKCSVCDVSRVFRSNYCPNCGARMKGEK